MTEYFSNSIFYYLVYIYHIVATRIRLLPPTHGAPRVGQAPQVGQAPSPHYEAPKLKTFGHTLNGDSVILILSSSHTHYDIVCNI